MSLIQIKMKTKYRVPKVFKIASGAMMMLFCLVSLRANPVDEDNRPRLISNDGAFYAWLKSGLLFLQTSDHGNKRTYLYCGSNGYLIPITTPGAFSQMFQEQLKDAQGSTDFIQKRVPYVTASFLEPSGSIVLNEGYAKSMKDPFIKWINASESDIQHSVALLEKYEKKRGQASFRF